MSDTVIDQKRNFKMLASAVAGQPVEVVSSQEETTWSSGKVIHLADGDGSDTVVIQAALIFSGSLTSTELVTLLVRPRIRERYLLLEAVRAIHELGFVVPPTLFRTISDIKLARFPASLTESLAIARGSELLPDTPKWFGTIRPTKAIGSFAKNELIAGVKNITDNVSFLAEDQGADPSDDSLDSGRNKKDGAGMGNPIANILRRIFGSSMSDASQSSVGAGTSGITNQGVLRAESARHAPERIVQGNEVLSAGILLGKAYPEWDSRRQLYRPAWCTVLDRYAPELEDVSPFELQEDIKLRRALASLGLAHERHRRQPAGDNIDLTALIEQVVDSASGADQEPRVYEIRRKTAHDLSVLVLLDATGSGADTGEEIRVFDAQREVAASLMSSLEGLGDRVAGYAFRAWGRHNVQLMRLKGFDDRFDVGVRRRIAAINPSGFTRLGAAIRHCSDVLMNNGGTVNRLLIVVGDGLPYDDGYESGYAQGDVRRALSEALERGVACVCVTVGSATDAEIFNRTWGEIPSLRIANPQELHKDVLSTFKIALRQAIAMGRDGRRSDAPASDKVL